VGGDATCCNDLVRSRAFTPTHRAPTRRPQRVSSNCRASPTPMPPTGGVAGSFAPYCRRKATRHRHLHGGCTVPGAHSRACGARAGCRKGAGDSLRAVGDESLTGPWPARGITFTRAWPDHGAGIRRRARRCPPIGARATQSKHQRERIAPAALLRASPRAPRRSAMQPRHSPAPQCQR